LNQGRSPDYIYYSVDIRIYLYKKYGWINSHQYTDCWLRIFTDQSMRNKKQEQTV